MENTMNDTRTPGEILADAVKLAEKTGHSYITVTNQCAERIIELLEDEEELGEELGNAVELIRKKDERIKKLLKEQDSEKKRILKIVWDTLHEGLSIDTVSDQDWVYERIRNRIEGTYPEV